VIKLRVSYEDYKKILTALLAHFGIESTDIIDRLHRQKPTDDGPEVDILKGKPLC
jgi:hypothetical protein